MHCAESSLMKWMLLSIPSKAEVGNPTELGPAGAALSSGTSTDLLMPSLDMVLTHIALNLCMSEM